MAPTIAAPLFFRGHHAVVLRAKSLDEFHDTSFDYILTRCADNQKNCTVLPGGKTYLQHAFPDPVPRAEEQLCGRFWRVRDQIKAWHKETFREVE